MSAMDGTGSGLDQTEIRFLVDKNADGILVVDEDGVVLFANPAAEQIFGRPPRTLVGSRIGVPVTAGETAEIAVHRPDGRQLEAEVRVVETTWNHRSARLASVRDISERKAIQERLSHAAKMEAVGRLTAGIAHDFNNLLTVVLGNLEGARRKLAADAAAAQLALDNAERGARRAAGLTQRLLAFARRKPLEPKVIDVNHLVSAMTDLLQRTLGEGIRVSTVAAPALWLSEVDPTELEAAILNLAVNARDAMPDGGELRVETENLRVDSTDASQANVRRGEYVVISVIDSGTGMTPEVLHQVFEPFFTTKGGRGTGLGLSQVYGFANQSGGGVVLRSNPGSGTTARIYLPRTYASRAVPMTPDGTPAAAAVPRGGPADVILVVEDDEDVRDYTAGSLRDLGYTVFEAHDAASALAIVAREPTIRLLFTDLGLPGNVDGKALSEQALKLRPDLRILITTAYAAAALIHDGRLDAGIDLLVKPFTFDSMAARIREVLDRRQEVEEIRILVVEDEALIRMLIVQTLEELGCAVEEAGSAGQASQRIAEAGDRLSAAIVDLGLPDRPGDTVIEELRVARPGLPVVLATGRDDPLARKRLQAVGRVEVLMKPFQPDEIERALARLGIATPRGAR